MIALSSRYVVPIAVLAVLTAVPVAMVAGGRRDADDCADPGALRATLLIPGSVPGFSERAPKPGELMFGQGTLKPRLSKTAPPLRFAVKRSFEPADVTSRPGRMVVHRLEAQKTEFRVLERNGVRLPVHWLEERTRALPAFAAYFYVYEGRPVRNPYRALLGSALRRLVGGPRPMTVFAAGGQAPTALNDAAVRQAEDWLFAAWDHYRAVCGPADGGLEIDATPPLR